MSELKEDKVRKDDDELEPEGTTLLAKLLRM